MAQSINLQITPNGVIPTIYASQFDVGREITFNLYDGSTAYTPPVGSTIRFEGKKSDGNGFSYNCTYVDNVVTVVLTDQMTVFAEEVPCELRIADTDNNDIGTLNILLSVEKSPIDGDTPMSDTEIPAIIELARTEQYNAEAWAEGTRNGVPVGPTDPTYQNNAKYYAEHSIASISSLQDTDIQNLTNGQILKYDSNSGKWVNEDESGGSSTLGGLTDVTLTTPTNNQVLKYDSVTQEWVNGDAPSGGAGGSEVTITTVESSLYGQTVTISDGQDTYTGTFDNTGLCIIQGVTITGSATVTSTDGVNTATGTLTMPYFGNYSIALSFFSATVNVTFPYANGATCTLSDGVTTLTANTSPMAFVVPNTGTWVATCTLDGQSKTESFVITTDGQTESHTFEYGTINLTYANEFRGVTLTCSSGGTTISKVAPVGVNSMAFYPPSTGTWVISGVYSGVTYYSNSVTITSLSTAESALLQTIPNGSTVTPINDVQKLLNCAGIFDKNYTTIGELLADSTSLLAVISDNNAVNYLVRSTGFASSVCANSTAMTDIGANDYCATTLLGDSTWCNAICNSTYFESVLNVKVPTMTSNTTPSGTVYASTDSTNGYKAFDGDDSSQWSSVVNGDVDLRYTFTNAVKIYKCHINAKWFVRFPDSILRCTNDGSTWKTLATLNSSSTSSPIAFDVLITDIDNAYLTYGIYHTAVGNNNNMAFMTVQFYGR